MQLWCNWDGSGGFCALDRQLLVHSIERMDGFYPHGKDVHLPRPIRSQTPVLSTLSGNRLRVIMRRREKTKRYRRALSIELRVRGGKIVSFQRGKVKKTIVCRVFGLDTSSFLVQPWCNKSENPAVSMSKQGSAAWIHPLNGGDQGVKKEGV